MDRRLTFAHIEAERRLRLQIESAVRAIWIGLPSYNEANLDEWLTRVLPVVQAGRRSSVALTEAYLARALERQPIGVDAAAIASGVRRGVPDEDVYRRPFAEVWGGLSAGRPWTAATATGLDRAISAATTDAQLAMRATVSEVGQIDDGIYGFERVPDGNACELCLIASTQRYHTEDLMPIHNHCGCSVAPITEPSGRVINRDLYTELKSDGAMDRITQQRIRAREEAAGKEPGSTSVAVREHGELGPVLTNSEHDFALL